MHGQQIVDKVVLEETYKPSSEGIIYTEDQTQRRPDFPVEEIPFTYGMGWQNAVYRGMCLLMYKISFTYGMGLQNAVYRGMCVLMYEIPSNIWHVMAECCVQGRYVRINV